MKPPAELVEKFKAEFGSLSDAEILQQILALGDANPAMGQLPLQSEMLRQNGIESPFCLATEIIDPTFYKKNFSERHRLMMDEILAPWCLGETVKIEGISYDPHDYTGLLFTWSRGTYKSTMMRILAMWFSLHAKLKRDHNSRQAFIHQVISKALEHSEAIREIARNCEKWRECYPEFSPRPDLRDWDEIKKWRWPNYTAYSATEYSFTFYGESSSKTGGHYDIRWVDDWVTEESVTNVEQLDQSERRFKGMDNLRDRTRRYNPWIAGGTPYHFHDTYSRLERSGGWLVYKVPAHLGSPKAIFDLCAIDERSVEGMKRIKAGLRKLERERAQDLNFPHLLPWEELYRSARAQKADTEGGLGGSHAEYNCFPGTTKVLMSDWTERHIEDLRVGDVVVGWARKNGGAKRGDRSQLQPTRVVATYAGEANLIEATMASGRRVVCTPDHQWWSGRNARKGTHRPYSPIAQGRAKGLDGLIPVLEPMPECPDQRAADYLGGMFDGEGSAHNMCITQCAVNNPAVCDRIRSSLTSAGFKFHECTPRGKTVIFFQISGGRQAFRRFMLWCQPAKAPMIAKAMFRKGTGMFGLKDRDRITEVRSLGGPHQVFNIQTDTGNFVADGYATSNCQLLLNPVPEGEQRFSTEDLDKGWISELPGPGDMHLFIRCDPAISKKKEADETAITVGGVDWRGHRYFLDGWVGREKRPTEQVRTMFRLAKKWKEYGYKVVNIGVESVAYQEALAQLCRAGVPSRDPVGEGESIPMLLPPAPIVSITRGSDMTKNERLLQMTGPWERGEVHIWTQNPIGRKTYDEHKGFPYATKNILDTCHDLWIKARTPARQLVASGRTMDPAFKKLLDRVMMKKAGQGPRLSGTSHTTVLERWGGK